MLSQAQDDKARLEKEAEIKIAQDEIDNADKRQKRLDELLKAKESLESEKNAVVQ